MMIPTNNKGFTILELLLYVSVSAIILFALFAVFSFVLQARVKTTVMAEVESQGMQIMQEMIQAIRNADSVSSPAAAASGTTLNLVMPTIADSPTVFSLSSGAIRIQEGTANTISLNNSRVVASALTFQNLTRASTPGAVRVSFTLTASSTSGRNEYSYAKTFTSGASLRHP